MDNESGVMAAFVRNVENIAKAKGVNFWHYPTGGQDRKLLGDTIFTNSTTYSLVEFKDTIHKASSEVHKKDRVLAVCETVFSDKIMCQLHDQCHFIAGDDLKTSEQVLFIYRHAVCNREVFAEPAEAHLPYLSSNINEGGRIYLDEYASDIFSSTPAYALSVTEFGKYLKVLVDATTGGRKGVEVCLVASDVNDQNRCISIRFDNVLDLHKWALTKLYKTPSLSQQGRKSKAKSTNKIRLSSSNDFDDGPS
ncbi:hypothetical protein A7317_01265 [Pseudomonas fluorescens]|uniref:hypothetical protein n=1 Tax=Pseudomonas TaxID=286 RepID=UPI00083CE22E|nr:MULTISPECIES: hypothetical protein [Pseudomonas]AOE65665.1 hypothetical protein A7317_01265 [Pseudomonas fluorescens]AOE71485.1 hypothetical protein A7319_01285 [Pseudomonas fluorescens]PMX11716.1 hypothetical protein C1Y23_32945 [Pseudomonas sp. GW460-12]PMX27702.1 hypothetical protein C1Y24_34215 [Pseudomonas sp. MPR-R2A4]PMX46084.1 hypothetical protein C1Y17_33555 [Pseudomonas sp. MPR-R2A6]